MTKLGGRVLLVVRRLDWPILPIGHGRVLPGFARHICEKGFLAGTVGDYEAFIAVYWRPNPSAIHFK
ncbi:MAG: hypothetical protein QUT30_11245 [Acidobacteriota bacterium]|nr:hypothetical protein [Acidobacteriota bacterium]